MEMEWWYVEQRDSPYQYRIRKFFRRKIQRKGREKEEVREILYGAPLACIVWISPADLALLRHVSGRNSTNASEIYLQRFQAVFSEN
jgi:hypothetical protein